MSILQILAILYNSKTSYSQQVTTPTKWHIVNYIAEGEMGLPTKLAFVNLPPSENVRPIHSDYQSWRHMNSTSNLMVQAEKPCRIYLDNGVAYCDGGPAVIKAKIDRILPANENAGVDLFQVSYDRSVDEDLPINYHSSNMLQSFQKLTSSQKNRFLVDRPVNIVCQESGDKAIVVPTVEPFLGVNNMSSLGNQQQPTNLFIHDVYIHSTSSAEMNPHNPFCSALQKTKIGKIKKRTVTRWDVKPCEDGTEEFGYVVLNYTVVPTKYTIYDPAVHVESATLAAVVPLSIIGSRNVLAEIFVGATVTYIPAGIPYMGITNSSDLILYEYTQKPDILNKMVVGGSIAASLAVGSLLSCIGVLGLSSKLANDKKKEHNLSDDNPHLKKFRNRAKLLSAFNFGLSLASSGASSGLLTVGLRQWKEERMLYQSRLKNMTNLLQSRPELAQDSPPVQPTPTDDSNATAVENTQVATLTVEEPMSNAPLLDCLRTPSDAVAIDKLVFIVHSRDSNHEDGATIV